MFIKTDLSTDLSTENATEKKEVRHTIYTLMFLRESDEKARPMSGLTEFIISKAAKNKGLAGPPASNEELKQLLQARRLKPEPSEEDYAKRYVIPTPP